MTTIQRQYSLPNCRLILQGVGSDTDGGRPLMSMLTSVECYLVGQKTPIIGGRDFLESLTTTVSHYAQGYLSGIQTLLRRRLEKPELVKLEQVEENLHRLTVQPEAGASGQADASTEIDLTTVQLFDLVEAVDQLFADAQTLPELNLTLDPLSKRHVKSAEPLAKRAGPAALGASGLAAAAALLFMLPAPVVKRSETSEVGTTTEQPASPSPTAAPPSDSGSSASPDATASPDSTAGSAASSGSESASAPASASTKPTASAAVASVGLNLTGSAEITDPAELDRLTAQLYNKLDAEWKKKPSFEGELIYRVGVNPSGEVVGYRYSNDAALTYLSDVPLANVQFATPTQGTASPASPAAQPTTPIAQFRVVFKSDGVLEISPWAGQPGGAAPSPSPTP